MSKNPATRRRGAEVPPDDEQTHRNQVEAWIEEARNRIDEKNDRSHARLILKGLRLNPDAIELLCLLSTLDPFAVDSAMPLAGMPYRKFGQMYNAFCDCAAIVPNIAGLDDEESFDVVVSEMLNDLDDNGRLPSKLGDPVLRVITHIQSECGDEVNQAVKELLIAEAYD